MLEKVLHHTLLAKGEQGQDVVTDAAARADANRHAHAIADADRRAAEANRNHA